jgi:hypothetical protein
VDQLACNSAEHHARRRNGHQRGKASVARRRPGSNAIRVAGRQKRARGAIEGDLYHFRRHAPEVARLPFDGAVAVRPKLLISPARAYPRPGLRGKRSRPEPARVVFCSIVCQSWRAGCSSRCGRSRGRPPGEPLCRIFADSRWNAEHRTSKHRVLPLRISSISAGPPRHQPACASLECP